MKSLEKSLTDGNQRAESCNRRNRSIVRYQSCGNIKQGVVALGVVANVGWQSWGTIVAGRREDADRLLMHTLIIYVPYS